jgi:hypothetical protein
MKLLQLLIIFLIIHLFSCTASDPFIDAYLLEDKWILKKVNAPDYPFPKDEEINSISISFPKTQEYELFLKDYSCNGTYQAKNNGDIEFKRSNCSNSCCTSEWDLYIITLIKKIKYFESKQEQSLKLFINETNYLTLEYEQNTQPIIEQ